MVHNSESRHHLYKVQNFTMLTTNPIDAVMTWLASRETGEEVYLPTLILRIQDLTNPRNTRLMMVSDALWRCDRERQRCGLPSYWQEIAEYLEDNKDYYIRRAAERASQEVV